MRSCNHDLLSSSACVCVCVCVCVCSGSDNTASTSRDLRSDMPKLFRRRQAYDTDNITVAVEVMILRVLQRHYAHHQRHTSSASPSITLHLPFILSFRLRWASGCVVECRIRNREVAGSNLSRGYFAPRSTQPSIPPGSVNEYQP